MRRNKRIRGVMFAIVCLCMIALAGSVTAKAETGTGTIKGNNVNVRSAAGTTGAKVTSMNNGDAVIVTGSASDTAGKKWYAVKFTKNGKEYTGYIIETYVNYTASTTSSSDSTAQESAPATQETQTEQTGDASSAEWIGTVKGTNVNVRKKAVSGTVVGSVSTGASVTVKKSKTGSDGKEWYYVSVTINGSSKKGWIRADFVKKEEAASSDTSNTYQKWKGRAKGTGINVRKSPVNGEVVSSISNGKKVTVRKEQTGTDGKVWYYITFNNLKNRGWIRSDFIQKIEVTSSETSDSAQANTEAESTEESSGQQPAEKKGTMIANYVRARKAPVDGAFICYLMSGAELIIKGEQTGSDNYVWYLAAFSYNGQAKEGYVRSDFVNVLPEEGAEGDTASDVTTDADFDTYLTEQGFPESYKNALRTLHNAHPEWEFRAVQTGLKWADVVAAESKVGTNLVAKTAITSWKSTEKTAYNWKNNTWYTFDGGAWVAASKDIVSYYLDPRNFLTEQAVFQFESLEYESYQNKTGVKRILKDTFMSGKFTEPNGSKKSYASTFVKAGKAVGVNPYHLAARCYQEQGAGKSGSISGTVSGYENIFNYYNIGAYAANGNSPVVQGLVYASTQPTNEKTAYKRPWTTRYKSIMGGAEYVAQKYVKVGQNTLYFQKFNVVNKTNGLYRHQYMTNIQAAEAEAVKMSKAYTSEDAELAFYIPVYTEMPETPCAKPISNANPNNYLATLEIKNRELTPVFSPDVDSYDLTVPKKVKKVRINATAVAGTSTVTGTGKVKLSRGENVFTVTCKAENGAEKTYTIHIVRE